MIHAFNFDDTFVLLDVESGAVHQIDALAYDVVCLMEQGVLKDDIILKLTNYQAFEVEEVILELNELEKNRELQAPEVFVQPQTETPIKAMCLNIAHDCNLRCKYCFASEGGYGHKRELMSFEVGKKAIDFLILKSEKRRNLEIDFFGGEPTMNFEVVAQLVKYGREQEKIHGKEISFTVTTNALNLSDQMIDFFCENMQNVVISIDGREEVNDRVRKSVNGKGSFLPVLENAKKLGLRRQKEGKEYYIRGTFTKYNLDFAKDVLFLNDCGFENISIEPVVLEEASPMALSEADLPTIYNEYETLAKEYLTRRKTQTFNFFHFMVDLQAGPCITKRIKGCGAGNEYIAITPSGEIYPCHQFVGNEKFLLGNVHDGELDEKKRERFSSCTVRTKPECASCWAKYYCSGGCAANAWAFNGDIYKPYSLACQMEKKRLECAIAIYIKDMHAN